jgi:3-dehydroquinate dehydratase-1
MICLHCGISHRYKRPEGEKETLKQVFPKYPAICAPLTGKTHDEIIAECRKLLPAQPDLLEWRADFFAGINHIEQVLQLLHSLKYEMGPIPLLFTVRSALEGGNPHLNLSSSEKRNLCSAVCQSGFLQYFDTELSNPADEIDYIREITRAHEVQLILSYHNFECTPNQPFLIEKFEQAHKFQADVGKVAVMPHSLEDVLDFMKSVSFIHKNIDLPIIAISMGDLGVMTRLFGWMFGSQLTFAAGENSSAPGQMPIQDVQAVIQMVKRSDPIL